MRQHWVAGGLALAMAAGPAVAQDGFVWMYNQYRDPDPYQTVLNLIYGIPESDAMQFGARCQIGAGGTFIVVELGADVAGLTDDTPVEVEFRGSGRTVIVPGAVFGTTSEVGIAGVAIPVETDDPLWAAITGWSELRYNVAGRPALALNLTGSRDPTRQFLSDCASLDVAAANPAPGAGPGAGPGADTSASGRPDDTGCLAFGSAKTVETGPATTVEFFNDTDDVRSVLWLDPEGIPQPYANLDPGQSYVQQTFVGHPWLITDGPGNCIAIYEPTEAPSAFRITGYSAGGD